MQPTIEKTLAGLYLTITIYIIDGLRSYATLSLTDEGRDYVESECSLAQGDSLLREISEDLEGSETILWIRPEDIGALTEAPMFTDEGALTLINAGKPNETFINLPSKGVFAYGDYQISDAMQEMLDGNEVRFEWHQGELEDTPLSADEQAALDRLRSVQPESEAATW